MSFLKPTPGELSDRISILLLKIKASREKAVDFKHFSDEMIECIAVWSNLIFELIGKGNVIIADINVILPLLHRANTSLWDLEDEVRAFNLVQENHQRLAELAKQIHTQNDLRNELIRKIDLVFGVERKEKLYK